MPSEALKALTQRVAELEAASGPEGALALLAGRVDGLEKRLGAELAARDGRCGELEAEVGTRAGSL